MKIGITGCTGRVGALLIKELLSGEWTGLSLAGGSSRSDNANKDYFTTNNTEELFERSDLIIDFTLPEATRAHIKLAETHKTPILIATTGLSKDDEIAIIKLAATVPVIYAANTSIAVTVLTALVEKAAAVLGADMFDIEITEAHHKHKIDAPSGTALMLGKEAAKARNANFSDVAVLSREGQTGARRTGEIGFSTIRGGDVVGEHTVSFLGQGERLELKQQASDRALYARGALTAAQWLVTERPENGLFSMRDVLGL